MDVTQNTKSILTLSKEGKNACFFFCTVTYFLMHTGGGEAESSTP